MRYLSGLRFLLVWPLARAVAARSRRSLAWRLALSHLMTVLLTLVSLFVALWCIGLVVTLLREPAAREPAADARAVTRVLAGDEAVSSMEENGAALTPILRALARRDVRLDSMPVFDISFASPRRLEHVRSISVIGAAGTVLASTDPSLVGRPAATLPGAAGEVVARALAGSEDEVANSVLRREGAVAATGAFPLWGEGGMPAAVLVEKSALSNKRGLALLGEAIRIFGQAVGSNLLLIAIPAMLAALAIGIPRARAIVRPVRALSGAAGAIAAGELSRRVEARGADEIAALAGSFNAMAGDLQRTLAQEAAERARVEERTRELSALLEVSQTVASTLELQPLVALALDRLRAVIDYTGASILTLDSDSLTILGSRGAAEFDMTVGLRFPIAGAESIWAPIARREPVIIRDVRGEEALARAYREVLGELLETEAFRRVRAWMAVPLALQDRVIGMLTMSRAAPGLFTERHARLARAVADQIALAIENARLYRQAQELAVLEERNRLARELHDSVTQSVFSLGIMARAAQAQHTRGLPVLPTTLERIAVLAGEALAEMRALLFELRPAALAEDGLCAALEKLVASFRVRTDAVVSCNAEADARLAPEVEAAIFRIVQEALGNAAKHARAGQIAVTAEEKDGSLRVTVADDGAGFDPATPSPSATDGGRGGMGLRSMKERAVAAGVTLRVESAPGEGTTVSVEAHVAAATARV